MNKTDGAVDINSFGSLISKIKWLIDSSFNASLRDNGINVSPEQWALLIVIKNNPGVSQSELATKAYKDKTNVTRIIDVLIKNNLIEKTDHKDDRRKYCINLTENGINTVNSVFPLVRLINNNAMSALNTEEQGKLIEYLSKIKIFFDESKK